MIKPIASLIIIVISLGFFFLNVKPAYDRLGMKKADLAMLTTTLKQADEIKSIIEQTKESMGSITPAEYARFDAFLPEEIDELRFANNLLHIGTARKIVIEDVKIIKEGKKDNTGNGGTDGGAADGVKKVFSLGQSIDSAKNSPSGTTAVSGYTTLKVSFSFVASYPATILLLGDIERSLGLINITSLSLKEYKVDSGKKAGNAGPPLYQSLVEIETYSL